MRAFKTPHRNVDEKCSVSDCEDRAVVEVVLISAVAMMDERDPELSFLCAKHVVQQHRDDRKYYWIG